MRKDINKITFAGELWRFLLKNSIIPTTLICFASTMALLLFLLVSVCYVADRQSRNSAQQLQQWLSLYIEQTQTLSCNADVLQAVREGQQSEPCAQAMYASLRSQPIRGDFFVLDSAFDCFIGSTTYIPAYLTGQKTSGLFYRMSRRPQETILMLSDAGNPRTRHMVLSIGRAVVSGDEICGYLVFELEPQELLEKLSANGRKIAVTDSYENVLLATQQDVLYNHMKLDSRYILSSDRGMTRDWSSYVVRQDLEELNLRFYTIVDMTEYYWILRVLVLLATLLLVLMTAANVVLYHRLAVSEASSLDQMIAGISQMREQGIYTALATPKVGTFSSLEAAYSRMLDSIRELVEANKQEITLRTTAEIRQLESQFNPHFIFNTLEVVRCLIWLEPAKANRMILDFSSLLRYSLDSAKRLVMVRDDMVYINSYLSMIQLGGNMPLEYTVEMEEHVKDCLIPKLCLQPVVENAIKYAAVAARPLVIRITAAMADGILTLTVSDNGSGMSQALLDSIRDTLAVPQTPAKYFGLYNIHRRIRLIYGEAYGLGIQSVEGQGTCVQLRLPAKEEPYGKNAFG